MRRRWRYGDWIDAPTAGSGGILASTPTDNLSSTSHARPNYSDVLGSAAKVWSVGCGVAVQRRRAFNYLARRSASNCCVGSSMTLWYGVDDSPSARLVALPTPDIAYSTGCACRRISVLAGGLIN